MGTRSEATKVIGLQRVSAKRAGKMCEEAMHRVLRKRKRAKSCEDLSKVQTQTCSLSLALTMPLLGCGSLRRKRGEAGKPCRSVERNEYYLSLSPWNERTPSLACHWETTHCTFIRGPSVANNIKQGYKSQTRMEKEVVLKQVDIRNPPWTPQ